MTIDENDRKLLNALVNDSKASLRKTAKKAGVSAATAMKRIKRLEKEGYIKSYSVFLDYEMLGFDIDVLIDIKISKGKLFELEKKIAKSRNVFAVYDCTGEFDAVVLARFRNRRGMDAFLKKIQKYDFVERTNTRLILNTIKEENIMV
ncbi:MAG: Lrp/AsnC family transcriptional regulator [Candidatus Aenigmarchaeota archaeon]|nr:Lrp/AsnC family transcriptional regulator [Candidatus Aenigmarchaeota archaeon]